MSTVLVTGGSGFIAGHCILQLLSAGHDVRTTVRSAAREAAVRAVLASGGAAPGARLSFAVADLGRDEGWAEAVAGCTHVLHVASPFPATLPKREEELIGPARDGALRVLRAARDAGVRRVVLTSSFAAVGYGHAPPHDAPFDETSWTVAEAAEVQPYARSKTLAERAAWDFVAREGGGLELAVVNPVVVLGPVLDPDTSTSVLIVQRLLEGAIPALPRVWLGVVDVRDVAELHLRAMVHPAAAGERFLAVAGDFLALRDVARVLRERLGPAARKVPRRELPDWIVRLAALWDPEVKQLVPELGRRKNASAEKARRVLGWSARPAEEAIVASAESVLRFAAAKGRRAA